MHMYVRIYLPTYYLPTCLLAYLPLSTYLPTHPLTHPSISSSLSIPNFLYFPIGGAAEEGRAERAAL